MLTPERLLKTALCAALTALPIAWEGSARAWGYDEHQEIACSAVARTCSLLELNDQLTSEGKSDLRVDQRRKAAQQLLCSSRCGRMYVPPGVPPVPSTPLFAACPARDFGDAVALIDFEHSGVKLIGKDCSQIQSLLGRLNEGIQSLWADDQFCPGVGQAYEDDHNRAVEAAAKASAHPEDVHAFRLVLFQEIEALHGLADAFAAGHLFARLDDRDDHFVTKKIHDEYNDQGARSPTGTASPGNATAMGSSITRLTRRTGTA